MFDSIDSLLIPTECHPKSIRCLSTHFLDFLNHPPTPQSSTKIESISQLSSDLKDEVICPICLRCMYRCTTIVPCLHNFCSSCLSKHQTQSTSCPICRESISNFRKNEILDIVIRSLDLDSSVRRTKEECEDMDESDDLLKGLRFIKYKDGAIYRGNYRNNKREGKGRHEMPSGDIYEGDWVNDKMEGYGVYKWKSGKQYEGCFKNNYMEGTGTFRWPSGATHVGMYKEDKAEGPGMYRSPDGTVFRGEYRNDKREGKGIVESSNGNVYESTWIEGVPDKQGIIRYYEEGGVYEGEWGEDRKREGKGVMRWANGDMYEGNWKDDKREGEGVMVWSDGTRYKGKWEDDMMVEDESFLRAVGLGRRGSLKKKNGRKGSCFSFSFSGIFK